MRNVVMHSFFGPTRCTTISLRSIFSILGLGLGDQRALLVAR